ncbi:MAG: hypothetical protein M0C28_14065 [Candidatus Moduliflexus flocculans]|nr:hypothetical protein [Candidatus Moduliflexus flocculans]
MINGRTGPDRRPGRHRRRLSDRERTLPRKGGESGLPGRAALLGPGVADRRGGRARRAPRSWPFPRGEVPPGGTWTSKTSGFGVSAAGRIEEAFGRYIQEIRANRVDFATFYFDWLCHDNSGPRESEVLANFAALRRLKELYGLQFDIYNSDAGLVESQGTYYPQFKANFLIAVPGRPEAPGRRVEGARDAPRALARPGRLRRDARGDGRPPGAAAVLGPGLQRRPVQDGHRRLGARPLGQVHPGEEISEPGRRPGRSATHRPGIHRHQSPHQRLALHADHHGLPPLARRGDLHRRPHQQRDGQPLQPRLLHRPRADFGVLQDALPAVRGPRHLLQQLPREVGRRPGGAGLRPGLGALARDVRDVLLPRRRGLSAPGPADPAPQAARVPARRRPTRCRAATSPTPTARSSLVLVRNMTWEPALKIDPSRRVDRPRGRARHGPDRAAAPSLGVADEEGGRGRRCRRDPAGRAGPLQPPAHPDRRGAARRADRRRRPLRDHPRARRRELRRQAPRAAGRTVDVAFLNFGDRTVRTGSGQSVPTGDKPWPITFPGAPTAGPSFARLADFRDDPAAAADGLRLAELAKFGIDDDALEIREMVRLKRAPSNLAEIEACRAYMWDKVVAAEGTFRNAFDGDPGTRWSDGFPRRSPFTGSPAAYRSETSLWRIDLGRPTDLATLELHVVRRTDAAFLEAVETSVRSEDLDADGRR